MKKHRDVKDILKHHSTEEGWDSLTEISFLLDYISDAISGRKISLLNFDRFLIARRTWRTK